MLNCSNGQPYYQPQQQKQKSVIVYNIDKDMPINFVLTANMDIYRLIVYEWNDMSRRRLLFQRANTINIQIMVLV